jgi:plasmid stability protein
MVRKLTDTIQLKVRLSEALRRQMEDAAARHGCSMNAEIVARLQSSIQKDQDAITELAKMLLDSVPDDVRYRMIQLMSETAREMMPRRFQREVDQRKDERKAGGKS